MKRMNVTRFVCRLFVLLHLFVLAGCSYYPNLWEPSYGTYDASGGESTYIDVDEDAGGGFDEKISEYDAGDYIEDGGDLPGIDDGNSGDYDGCIDCRVEEFQVNSYTAGSQGLPAVAMAADGRFQVVWQSYGGQDGSGHGVYGQRYNAQGIPVGGEFRVNTDTEGDQTGPGVAMAPDGRCVVVWACHQINTSTHGICGQSYDQDGLPWGTEFVVAHDEIGVNRSPGVAVTPEGRFVVVWEGHGRSFDIRGRLYDEQGQPVGDEFPVNTYTHGSQENPAVAMADDGSFVPVWQSDRQDGSYWGVFARHYNELGHPSGDEFQVNEWSEGVQRYPSVATTSTGSFVVVWSGYGEPYQTGIYGQRFDEHWLPIGGGFQANTSSEDVVAPTVAMTPGGRFVVVWSGSSTADQHGIYGQRFSEQALPIGGEFHVNTHTGGYQLGASVAIAPDGRFVVVWGSDSQDGSDWGVFAQKYAADGTPLGLLPW